MKGPTKAELQETLDQVGETIADMLDPSLTRKQLVDQLKDLDELVNGIGEDDDDEETSEVQDEDDAGDIDGGDDDDDDDEEEEAA
jgi:hypothetical protein